MIIVMLVIKFGITFRLMYRCTGVKLGIIIKFFVF
jgi:hypothetical protein